jgi:putative ABC transport system permease protein
MLRILLKKIARNGWLFLCLAAATIIAVAVVASVPVYTGGTLQRLLTRDLEKFQEQMGMYPGRYTLGAGFLAGSSALGQGFPAYDSVVRDRLVPALGLPIVASATQITMDFLQALPAVQREAHPTPRYLELKALEGAADKFAMVQGRVFVAPPAGTGIYDAEIEAIVSEQALVANDLRVGEVYTVTDTPHVLEAPLRIRVVGVYRMKDPADPWWFLSLRNYESSLITDFGFLRDAIGTGASPLLTGADWSFALDYHAITVASLGRVLATLESQTRLFDQNQVTYDLPMLDILRAYGGRERQLLAEMWFLQLPMLLMLAFFVSMVGTLIVDADRNEIAVLKSRGARTGQVFTVYAAECAAVALAAMAVGPPLALVVCRMIGASNGFLEFVQRAGLPLRLDGRAYGFGSLAALLMAAAMLTPALRASRTTIVLHKQRRSRAEHRPFWQRIFLDLVLLALAGYGYYAYRTRQSLLVITNLDAASMPLDPMLFLVSTLFVVGAGLLFLRLYPVVVRLVFRLGRRAWTPSLYAAFLDVGRSAGGEQFLMLFLFITLSVGILDAATARTVNRNLEDAVRYRVGADITLAEEWPSNLYTPPPGSSAFAVEVPRGSVTAESGRPLEYHEPAFDRFTSLAGVQKATKVLRQTSALVTGQDGQPIPTVLMGIEPDGFADVAAFPPRLLPFHQNAYLNELLSRRDGLLVSPSFAEQGVALGDTMAVSWPGGGYVTGVVCGFVPWWPTFNPLGDERGEPTSIVVANLAHVQTSTGMQPYQVWMRKAPGATGEGIAAALAEQRLELLSYADAGQLLVAAKNDSLVQALNGVLTMGFVVTMIVSTIGFLIYWLLSLQGRTLQFGVFRAMGLSRSSVILVVVWEQVLVSLVAILVGIVIGGVAGDLFVPLIGITRSAAQQVPPFRVVTDAGDYGKLYVIVGAMLTVGLAVLGGRIARIRMAEALKLGEE